MSGDCLMCTHPRGGTPGSLLDEDEHWVVGMLPGLEVPGWIGLILRRHAEGIEALSPAESASLGPALARVSRALRAATDAEKVYIAAFGENFPHVHLLLMARGPEIPPARRGPALQGHVDDYRDVRRARDVASAVRAELTTGAGAVRASGGG